MRDRFNIETVAIEESAAINGAEETITTGGGGALGTGAIAAATNTGGQPEI